MPRHTFSGQSDDDMAPTTKPNQMGTSREQHAEFSTAIFVFHALCRSAGEKMLPSSPPAISDTGSLRRRSLFLEELRTYQVSLVSVAKDPKLGNPLFTSSLRNYISATGIAIQNTVVGSPVGFISGLRTYLGGASTILETGNPVGFVTGLRTYLGGAATILGTGLTSHNQPSLSDSWLRTYLATGGAATILGTETPVGFTSGLRTYLGADPTTAFGTGNTVTFISGLRTYLLGGVSPIDSVEIVKTGSPIKFISELRSFFLGGQTILETSSIIKPDTDPQADPTRQKPSKTDAKSLPTSDSGSSDDDGGSSKSSGQSSSTDSDTGDGFSNTSSQGPKKSGGKTGKPSNQDTTVPSGTVDNPDTNPGDPSSVPQLINPVSTGEVSQRGSKGVVNQPVSTPTPDVSSGTTGDPDADVGGTSVVTQSTTATSVSTDTVSQPGSTGGVSQASSSQNSNVSSGSTDTLDTTSTVTNPSVVTQPTIPVSTSGASQTVDTTSTSSLTNQSSLTIADLLAIIQTLLSIINGKTPTSLSPPHINFQLDSPDALAKVTSQLSQISFNTSTSETECLKDIREISEHEKCLAPFSNVISFFVDNNPSDASSSLGVGVQELKQSVVIEAAPSDPGSSSTEHSSKLDRLCPDYRLNIHEPCHSPAESNDSSDSSSLGSSDSSPGKLDASSDSSSVDPSGICQKLPVLRARNIASGELNGSPHSSLVDLSDTAVEDTAQHNVESPPMPASTVNISPTGVPFNEPPCSAITGILERSDLLNTLVPTMSRNSESGTLYGKSSQSYNSR
ncbi:uncharacterized protein MELLADRAFT_92796 [Melampsora larici-populina 98AG31]|uniref:Uncharacterized protein n=1 Tax=Melampsora larici-populina (strain 98AG31 / pathotype 3-4-7) TaxID=747676 RepID=F4S2S6_MELLP|nr:uncharacterized protein MELLADRAFT_92796 [Melampsora larici-populina 98AG31]EGG01051.1 hypothetical protein MELLADRAFT_92796 [Melampsora larici-populina 98AG31]